MIGGEPAMTPSEVVAGDPCRGGSSLVKKFSMQVCPCLWSFPVAVA